VLGRRGRGEVVLVHPERIRSRPGPDTVGEARRNPPCAKPLDPRGFAWDSGTTAAADARSTPIVPIACHPEPASDADVDGTTTGGTGAAEDSPTAPGARSGDALTERILARGDAAAPSTTFAGDSDGEQYDLADRQA